MPPSPTKEPERIAVFVSPSEPDDACARLVSYGLNAMPSEQGTDYVWWPHGLKYGIERKTVSNLLESLKSRQLVEQAQRGVKDFDRYFILIEGEYRSQAGGQFQFYAPRHPSADTSGWATSGFRYDAIDGMMLDLALLGCVIVHAPSFQYDRKIAAIVSNTSSETHRFIRERQRPDLPVGAALMGELYSHAMWALMALPGCGPEVAQALLAKTENLQQAMSYLANVNASQFLLVNGKKLGSKRAERLREAVTHSFAPASSPLVH